MHSNVFHLYPKPSRPVKRPLQGLGISISGSIDVASLANSLVNALWPPIESKVEGMVPVVANAAIDAVKARMPELVDAIKPQIPVLLNTAMPMIEKEANKLAAQYEARYLGTLGNYLKYEKPIFFGIIIVGGLVAAAAVKTLVSK